MFKPLKVGAASPVEALRKLPVDGQSKSLQHTETQHDQRQQLAAVHTALLLGGFRKSEADDPEIFVRSIAHVLASYDVDIQKQVIEPGKWKWPPNPYEVREACERIAQEEAARVKRDASIAQQLKDRAEYEAKRAVVRAAVTAKADHERREAEAILARYLREAAAPPNGDEEFWS